MGSVTVGDRSSFTGIMIVTPRHTAPNLDDTWRGFKDLPLVFATAMMCGFIEQTCIEALYRALVVMDELWKRVLKKAECCVTPRFSSAC